MQDGFNRPGQHPAHGVQNDSGYGVSPVGGYGAPGGQPAPHGVIPVAASPNWEPPLAQLKQRDIGLCILLYIFTFGIYSLFWIYGTHNELPRRSGRDDRPWPAVMGFLVPAIAAMVLVVPMFMSVVGAGGGQVMEVAMASGLFMILVIVAVAVFAVYWQIRIYGRLSERLNQLSAASGGSPSAVNGTYVTLWVIFSILGAIPFIGFLFSIAGFVLMVVWWVSTQKTMNELSAKFAAQAGQPLA